MAINQKPLTQCVLLQRNPGEMSELAEGARLEIACTI